MILFDMRNNDLERSEQQGSSHPLDAKWDWALDTNRRIPRREYARGAQLHVCLPDRIKRASLTFARFIAEQSAIRRHTGCIPYGWRTLCALTAAGYFLYTPRSTAPIYYFCAPNSLLFQDLVGLDIGARIRRADDLNSALPSDEQLARNPLLQPSFLPHWKHYEMLGASMQAIDLIPEPTEPRIQVGDARLLMFADGTFDFITIPMILGPTNPCSTALEIAACIGEMYRVLRKVGFVYVADRVLNPSVCFAAQTAGFEVAYSKGRDPQLPVGTFFLKTSPLEAVPMLQRLEKLPRIHFAELETETVLHCNLLDDPEPPVVRAGSFY